MTTKKLDEPRRFKRSKGLYKKPKYDMAQMADLLLDHAGDGGGIYSFGAWLVHTKEWEAKNIPHVETLKSWIRNHPEFKQIYTLCRELALGTEILFLDSAKAGRIKNYNYKAHQFKLMNLFGWKDRVEHSGRVDATFKREDGIERLFSDPESARLALELAERLADKVGSDQASDTQTESNDLDTGDEEG